MELKNLRQITFPIQLECNPHCALCSMLVQTIHTQCVSFLFPYTVHYFIQSLFCCWQCLAFYPFIPVRDTIQWRKEKQQKKTKWILVARYHCCCFVVYWFLWVKRSDHSQRFLFLYHEFKIYTRMCEYHATSERRSLQNVYTQATLCLCEIHYVLCETQTSFPALSVLPTHSNIWMG